jgi:HEAT repeat protein
LEQWTVDTELQQALLQLHSANPDERCRAVVALRAKSEIFEAQHALLSSLNDENGHVRILAAEALAKAGLHPDRTIPVLIATIEATDESHLAQIPGAKDWRRIAVGVLGRYGARATNAIPVLRTALLDPDINIRGYAAKSLGEIGPDAIVALQDLRTTRQAEEDDNLRSIYDRAIQQIMQSKRFIVIAQDDDHDEVQ